MSQSSMNLANLSFPAARTQLNAIFGALSTLSSGATAPATTFANMLWYDTTAKILKMRSEADDAWISVAYLDQTADAFRILDDTQVVNGSGTQTGLLGDQATATWEAGTGTTESLISPAKVKAAIAALGVAATAGPTATTSGTAIDFTSIPAGVDQIDIGFNGVSLSGTDSLLVQLSTGASFATSGYVSTTASTTATGQSQVSATSGLVLQLSAATSAARGIMHLQRVPGTNTWISSHSAGLAVNSAAYGGGTVTLGGALDGVRLTRTGTNTFDAGSAFLRYR